MCCRSAVEISELFAHHVRTYGSLGICAFHIRCLLVASVIHLVNLRSTSSAVYFEAACGYFHNLENRIGDASNSIEILTKLVRRWRVSLNDRQRMALYTKHRGRSHEPTADSLSRSKIPLTEQGTHATVRDSQNESANPSRALSSDPDSVFPMNGESERVPQKERPRQENKDDTSMSPDRKNGNEQHLPFIFMPFPNEPTPLLTPTSKSVNGPAGREGRDEPMNLPERFEGLDFEGPGDWLDPFMGYSQEDSTDDQSL